MKKEKVKTSPPMMQQAPPHNSTVMCDSIVKEKLKKSKTIKACSLAAQ